MICGPPKFNSADTILFFNFSHWIKFNFIFLLRSTIMRKKKVPETLYYIMFYLHPFGLTMS